MYTLGKVRKVSAKDLVAKLIGKQDVDDALRQEVGAYVLERASILIVRGFEKLSWRELSKFQLDEFTLVRKAGSDADLPDVIDSKFCDALKERRDEAIPLSFLQIQNLSTTNEKLRSVVERSFPAPDDLPAYPWLRICIRDATAMSFDGGDTFLALEGDADRLLRRINEHLALKEGYLSSAWTNTLKALYLGSTTVHMLPIVEQMYRLKKQERFRLLLEPPAKYKRAYRIMVNLSADYVAKLLNVYVMELPEQGVVQNLTYKPTSATGTSSWTVNPKIFSSKGLMKAIGIAELHESKYSILLECDLSAHRKQFLYNPDTLPNFLKCGNYGREREVLSIGDIPIRRASFFSQEDYRPSNTNESEDSEAQHATSLKLLRKK